MRALVDVVCRWICPNCEHRNPGFRFQCRRCRTARPPGS